MSRSIWITLLALLIILIAVAVWWYSSRESLETTTAQRGSIDVTIQTVGSIEIGSEIRARSRVAGSVDMIGAERGDRVEEGDILVMLDIEELERRLEEAELRLEEAEFALQAVENNVEDNPTDENQLELIAAQNNRQAALRAVEAAENDIENAAITAPEASIVAEILVQDGDPVGQSQTLAILFSEADLRLVANVDELDLPNVREGAEVRFRLDSFPGTELRGEVLRTAPVADQQGGATIFATEIAIRGDPDLDIRPGMNADVTVVTDQREDVLLVPESAIRTVGERSFIQVVEDGAAQDREVVLGYRAAGEAEVVSGLEEGEEIVIE